MKTIFLLATLIAYGLSEVQGTFMKSRTMLNKIMKRTVINEYMRYGCYCEQRGKGAPKDATDRCCLQLDCCYANVEKDKCDIKRLNFLFFYEDGVPLCGVGTYCQKRMCDCDLKAVYCIQKYRNTYEPKYRNLTNSQCTGIRPKC